ncbi:(Fe-S)-binding protein [archaeon]|nr:(Fe-S)-binding protein [archaeon]
MSDDEILHQYLTCTMCGFCRPVCPVYRVFENETCTPRAIVGLAYGLLRGELDVAQASATARLSVSCRACEVKCPSGVEILKVIRWLRRSAWRQGIGPEKKRSAVEYLKKGLSINGKQPRVEQQEDVEVVLFTGCCERTEYAVVEEVFKQLGVSYSVVEQLCCGLPLLLEGLEDLLREHQQRALSKLPREKRLVTACPGCAYMLKEAGLEVAWLPRFLSEKLKLHQLKPVDQRVVVHEPCFGLRYLNAGEDLDALLRQIPGLTLVKPEPWCGAMSFCCGAGCGWELRQEGDGPKLIRRERVNQLRGAAEKVVTACPHCYRWLSEEVPVLRIEELVRMALA